MSAINKQTFGLNITSMLILSIEEKQELLTAFTTANNLHIVLTSSSTIYHCCANVCDQSCELRSQKNLTTELSSPLLGAGAGGPDGGGGGGGSPPPPPPPPPESSSDRALFLS